jgi:hypothetical protein
MQGDIYHFHHSAIALSRPISRSAYSCEYFVQLISRCLSAFSR